MKLLFYILVLTTTLLEAKHAFAAASPLKSKENIEFITKSEQPLLDLMKTNNFLGVLVRTDKTQRDLRHVDLYAFKDIQEISINQQLCEKLLEKIYGPRKEISLKVQNINLYKSHSGNTCEATITNPDSKAKFPERRTIIGFIKAKPYALVFKFSKPSKVNEQEEARKFWDSLH